MSFEILPTFINIQGLAGTGKTTTATEVVDICRDQLGLRASLFQPSQLLREYAAGKRLKIHSLADYLPVHAQMEAENPNFMVEGIMALADRYDVVAIDGLRKFKHASALQQVLGAAYRTSLLTAPDHVRFERLQADAARAHRPENIPTSIAELVESELPLLQSPDYDVLHIWDMRDAPSTAIDTTQYIPRATAEIIIKASQIKTSSQYASHKPA